MPCNLLNKDKYEGKQNKVENDDVALISGSLPKGFENAKLFELVEKIRTLGASIVLDTELDRIDQNNGLAIDFVKPNIDELRAYLEKHSISDLDTGLKRLSDIGVKHIIITCGAKGAYIICGDSKRALFFKSSFDGLGKEAIGSGDAFVGALAASLSNGGSLVEATEHAIAAGHSNIFHEGPGRIGDTFQSILKSTSSQELSRDDALEQLSELLRRA